MDDELVVVVGPATVVVLDEFDDKFVVVVFTAEKVVVLDTVTPYSNEFDDEIVVIVV